MSEKWFYVLFKQKEKRRQTVIFLINKPRLSLRKKPRCTFMSKQFKTKLLDFLVGCFIWSIGELMMKHPNITVALKRNIFKVKRSKKSCDRWYCSLSALISASSTEFGITRRDNMKQLKPLHRACSRWEYCTFILPVAFCIKGTKAEWEGFLVAPSSQQQRQVTEPNRSLCKSQSRRSGKPPPPC